MPNDNLLPRYPHWAVQLGGLWVLAAALFVGCGIVVDPPGHLVAIITALPQNGAAPLDVLLDARGSGFHGGIGRVDRYEWRFGDGEIRPPDSVSHVHHTYDAGDYNACVIVSGFEQEDTACVQVRAE